jgi:hypothetical protein
MAHVSRPLIALLAATVLFFALWVVALKPGGSSTGANSQSKKGLGQYQADINAAHQAVRTANAAGARAATGPAPTTTPAPAATAPVAHTPARSAAKPPAAVRIPVKPVAATAGARMSAVQRALRSHKLLALLFYNPSAPDDRAVRQELAGVPTHGGKVVKLAIPLDEINGYAAITSHVPVNFSPTLVLVAPNGQADELVGYTDPFEISQRVADGLAVHP